MSSLEASEVVLTFLESVGRRSEAELYLELFRKLPKESFAVIAAEASVARHARRSLVEQLGFLTALGLVAPLLLGAFDPAKAATAREALVSSLRRAGLQVSEHDASEPALGEQLKQELVQGVLPIVSFSTSSSEAERFTLIEQLVTTLESRKLVVLRDRGGLGPSGNGAIPLGNDRQLPTHEGGISVINLHTDLAPLLAAKVLQASEEHLLGRLAKLAESDRKLQVSVASPMVLLKELFTVRGAGTLIKRGATIERHNSYSGLDLPRLEQLLESGFQKALLRRADGGPCCFERAPLAIYLEQNYRGAAILEPGAGAAFLTKFVVGPVAQGEGMGRDLWESIKRDQPRFYWRAKPNNPIRGWYADNCDGLLRLPDWTVYWRGLQPNELPDLVTDALSRPEDFGPGTRESAPG